MKTLTLSQITHLQPINGRVVVVICSNIKVNVTI